MKFDARRMSEKKLLMLTILAVCMLVGLLGGALYLGFVKHHRLRQEVVSLQDQLDRVADRVAQIKGLTRRLEQWEKIAPDYIRILPDDTNKEELLEVFSEVKNETGVRIGSVKINEEELRRTAGARGAKTPESQVQKVSFELSIKGDYFQFGRFVNLLETYPRFMEINEFALSEPDEELMHDITLSGCTYKYMEALAGPERTVGSRSTGKGAR